MLRLLIKNGLRVDFRKFIPFVATVVVTVLIVSGTATVKQGFLDVAMDPLVRYLGGDTMVIKSEKAPGLYIRSGGSVRISKQLFRPAELLSPIGESTAGQELHLALWDCQINGRTSFLSMYGVQRLPQVAQLQCSEGQLPDFTQSVPWDGGVIPVAVYMSSNMDIKLGDKFTLPVPGLIPEGGGSENKMGIPEPAANIDYLDYDHLRKITCEVTAIVSETWCHLAGNSIYMPLRTLQDVVGAPDYVNGVYLLGETKDPAVVEQRAEQLQSLAPTGFFFTPAPAVFGISAEMNALEEHADRLLQMVFAISALMVVNVLVLILTHRRKQDAQLLFIGLRRSQLLASVGWQVLVVSALAVLVGLAVPLSGGALAFRTNVLSKVPIGRFLALVPMSTLLALLVAAFLLPQKTDTLEAMRND